ncbi:bifunctional riboflavin kinase/FAD synthetase [Rhodocyclus tenuis]|uniref:bifunctional riboflavin kinase/FAD synthetase n=1 Tax=Rhodocyclus gracilis TaxID=2929842 RepID=UPI0012989556|nr:bifunctional riboflavin kinase/FAD synthetase [Rhodocyclus gracilis]MRD73126.1 bifunctional riboflavin kinase/FAD synthetase [Rhodocyclus gracilis]
MLVQRGFSRPAPADTALTIGNFDGVHLGHRALLSRLGEAAQGRGLLPAALTFEPHPREFFTPEATPARLSTLREKLELLDADGVRLCCVGRFNARFAALSAEQFIDDVLVRCLRVRHLIIGDDFHFGAGRTGDFAQLRAAGERHGFAVESMRSVLLDGERISSSAVRDALAKGQLQHAERLLGRPYAIDGRIVRGQQLGRRLGFATANIRIRHDRPPLSGVFAVEVSGLSGLNGLDSRRDAPPLAGIANLGVRPSIDANARPLLEVHLFDFDRDIYGAHLSVRFLSKLRDEMSFPNLDALRAQIARDAAIAHEFFAQRAAATPTPAS